MEKKDDGLVAVCGEDRTVDSVLAQIREELEQIRVYCEKKLRLRRDIFSQLTDAELSGLVHPRSERRGAGKGRKEETSMRWVRFRIRTITEAEDIIISTLYEIGLEGAQIEDRIPLTPLEKEQCKRQNPRQIPAAAYRPGNKNPHITACSHYTQIHQMIQPFIVGVGIHGARPSSLLKKQQWGFAFC